MINALAKLYPSFEFDYKFVEEEGWGGTAEYENGELTNTTDWDIPTTHKDRIEVFDYCYACEDGDEEDMEELGCPR